MFLVLVGLLSDRLVLYFTYLFFVFYFMAEVKDVEKSIFLKLLCCSLEVPFLAECIVILVL